jgi:uncharacterized protein YndB with AHSA1/START domain
LIDWVCERNIPGDFAMDGYFTSAEVLNHIHGKTDRFGRPRGYVGDLKRNRKVQWKGQVIKVTEPAASIPPEDRKEWRIGDQRQWSFTVTLHIPEVNHKVRIVILWRYRQDSEPIKILVTNRIAWETSRIVRRMRRLEAFTSGRTTRSMNSRSACTAGKELTPGLSKRTGLIMDGAGIPQLDRSTRRAVPRPVR